MSLYLPTYLPTSRVSLPTYRYLMSLYLPTSRVCLPSSLCISRVSLPTYLFLVSLSLSTCLHHYMYLVSLYLLPASRVSLPNYLYLGYLYLSTYLHTYLYLMSLYPSTYLLNYLYLVSLYLPPYILGLFTYLPTYISCLFTYQYLGSLYLSTYLPTYISCLLQRYFWEYDFWDLVQRAITKIGWMCGFFFWVLRFFFCVSQCNAATANRLNPVIHSLCDRVLDYLFNIRLRRYNKENLSDSIEFNQVGEL